MNVRICKRSKTVWHKNKINGEEWSTDVPLKGFEVWGGLFPMTTHTTLKGAEKEKQYRISINEKFPFIMPRSKREIDNCKYLGIDVPLPYQEMETGKIIK
jgi:hypothetical protein